MNAIKEAECWGFYATFSQPDNARTSSSNSEEVKKKLFSMPSLEESTSVNLILYSDIAEHTRQKSTKNIKSTEQSNTQIQKLFELKRKPKDIQHHSANYLKKLRLQKYDPTKHSLR